MGGGGGVGATGVLRPEESKQVLLLLLLFPNSILNWDGQCDGYTVYAPAVVSRRAVLSSV